jgi:eukaryotic-like serine/threonine-protein kinase
MGRVWRAHHTALKRDDALKVLPDSFAADPERLARFQREAQILASLNHPHIAHVYGLEETDGVTALVMELVEGPTLADRITLRAIPVDEALSIAKQIADALETAHEKGIVHRDLKPANVKVRSDGTVKVLDFGLAKAMEPAGTWSPGVAQSRMITTPAMTQAGVILGTPDYMSPEQVQQLPVDKRTDIWAFGVVLYEMLTGRRGFDGASTAEVLSNVLKTEPDWNALPPHTPSTVRWLLRQCLHKERSRRLRDIGDARLVIEGVVAESEDASGQGRPTPAPPLRERLLWAALVVIVAVGAAAAWTWRRADAVGDEVRLEITAPPTTEPTSLAISPDGKTVVFVGISDGQPRLWVRSLAAVTARPLPGTENATSPFWSPDGRSVGFAADNQLKRVDIETGSVRRVVGGGALSGAWNRDGTILFDRAPGSGLFRVSAEGGRPEPVTHASPQARDHYFPQFLPDQRQFLFYATGTAPGIYVGALGPADAPRRILDAQSAIYVTSGHLLFVRQGTLFSQPFDPSRAELAGTPTAIAEHIVVREEKAALSASASGAIVYRTGPSIAPHRFVWYDRSGKPRETLPGSDFGGSSNFSLSPDGTRLAIPSRTDGTSDIWLLDIKRGVPSRLTSHPEFDLFPVWSPDGRRVAFTSNRRGTGFEPFMKAVDDSVREEALVDGGAPVWVPNDWSPDGQFILATIGRPDTGLDIWALPFDGRRMPLPIAATPFNETSAQFSPPGGRWIAYQSDESGPVEIYAQPFRGPGRKVRISGGGGVQVRWRRDGKELFYLASDNRLMAVPIQLDSSGENLEVGTPMPLFQTRLAGTARTDVERHYTVSADGQRFLMGTPTEVSIPITVVLNWKPQP